MAWFYVHCAACSIKTNSFCTTITQPNVFPAAVKSWGERSIIERKEIPPPIVIMLTNYPYPQYWEKCQALGADYFFDKVTEIEKIDDTFQQLLTDKS
ncbi:MAG: hypothetical protein ACYDH8_01250 [Syntrophales bacterium]